MYCNCLQTSNRLGDIGHFFENFFNTSTMIDYSKVGSESLVITRVIENDSSYNSSYLRIIRDSDPT